MEFQVNYNCLVFYTFGDFCNVSEVAVIPLMTIRYILIININKSKQSTIKRAMQDKKIDIKVPLSIKIAKRLNSHWIYLIVLFISGLITLAYSLSVFPIFGFKCINSRQNYIIRVGVHALGVIPCILYILISVYDVYVNRHVLFKCRLKDFFIKQDPYYFRVQQAFGICLIGYFGIWALAYMTGLTAIEPLVNTIMTTILWQLILVHMIHLPISLTIWKLLKKQKEKGEEKDNSLAFLNNPEVYKMFLEYTELEWSTENPLCYKDIQKYKKLTNPKEKRIKAQYIYDLYLNGENSKLEVNVSRELCLEIKTQLDSEEDLPEELFKNIELVVIQNICDTFQRFRKDPQFVAYKKREALIRKSLKSLK